MVAWDMPCPLASYLPVHVKPPGTTGLNEPGCSRLVENVLDGFFRQMAFNLFRGGRILGAV
jgi:hypothetical protein